MKLEKALKELSVCDDDVVFIHHYGKSDGDEPCLSKDIDEKALKKNVKKIHPCYGGREYGYKCYLFILE